MSYLLGLSQLGVAVVEVYFGVVGHESDPHGGLITIGITRQVPKHLLHVFAEDFHHPLFDHRVGNVDGEDDGGRRRLFRVTAVI